MTDCKCGHGRDLHGCKGQECTCISYHEPVSDLDENCKYIIGPISLSHDCDASAWMLEFRSSFVHAMSVSTNVKILIDSEEALEIVNNSRPHIWRPKK